MEAAQALRELRELSSQIEAAVVLGADSGVLASDPEGEAPSVLANVAAELAAAASELGSGAEVTRVEVELEEGALFVVAEGDLSIAVRTGPEPTSGLVIYDLRTCLRSIDAPAAPKRRLRSKKEGAE